MCQSKSKGGRRCTGGRGRGTETLVAEAATARQVGADSAAPSREQADALAAALPADRTGWDGKPLSDGDRRLFALRESGYQGPIDQDGYPAATGEEADILRRMARDRGELVDW